MVKIRKRLLRSTRRTSSFRYLAIAQLDSHEGLQCRAGRTVAPKKIGEGGREGLLERLVSALEAPEQIDAQRVALVGGQGASRDLAQGCGGTAEHRQVTMALVHVNANPNDDVAPIMGFSGLGQDSGDLLLAHEQVIRPLDGSGYAQRLQALHCSQ